MWSLNKPVVKKKTTKMMANTLGLYAINGESVVDFKENSKPEKTIVIILDNFRSHWAKKRRRKGRKLKIILLFLPPYSPDLSPIEQIWRVIKRVLSPLFIKTLDELKEVISKSSYEPTQRISFAEEWIKRFLNIG